ncbi:hypothetical protein [Flavobacterium quisquiliarum]|uniref:Uncharacterized protein n=1 Tax=Flavobacterium quisquiliarum TaxID=1834436 RepID=A0ABV8W4H6_9FLAO|nr:hypothetical protein [Flavobacterium quisquiliarum]MBW1658383.1 hypothetical protein [Flavobacterium quisquiliarum]NWL02333.1 hypothetical protein [Flavobacterium collinsii]
MSVVKTIIENLKILSENFKYKSDTFSNSVIFINEVNKIKIQPENKVGFSITYNLYFGEKMLLVSEEAVYHFCLDLFKRKNSDIEVIYRAGKPIDVSEWFKIERKEALDAIDAIQKELEYNYRLKYLFLESKRFDIIYFNDLMIIEDKKKEYLFNVFDFKILKLYEN